MPTMDRFNAILNGKRDAVLADIRRLQNEEKRNLSRDVGLREVMDTKDISFQDSVAVIRNAGLRREAEELEDIRAALARIENGSYGICIVCDEVIPEARLEAWPTAKRCRPCQEKREAEKAGRH